MNERVKRRLFLAAIVAVPFGPIVGALYGAVLAGSTAGGLSALEGGALGAPVGILVVFALATVGPGIIAVNGRWEKRAKLSPKFGQYWARTRRGNWERATKELATGQRVRGVVVLRTPAERLPSLCGKAIMRASMDMTGRAEVYLDIGCGFPAHIEVPEDVRLPAIGSDMEAQILEFDDWRRTIVLGTDEDPTGGSDRKNEEPEPGCRADPSRDK